MNNIIKAENVGKKFNIGTAEPYYSLRDSLTEFFRFRKKKQKGEFWALRDVNFEIAKGESVGIVGRNGAGKSTLLKILSQINPLTTGKITMGGRVASLLEVGTGFHPELTGRENIYLNGAILGMTRNEIKRKFDEIVDFAEVEKFLDTPVKRYSSGMYVRLAFAVAAHLEPEILIVDEVLAVGDAQFQKKCLNKMKEVGNEGRTVLFVSHNMAAVQEFCQRCILLDKGHLVADGPTLEVIDKYLSNEFTSEESDIDLTDKTMRKNSLDNSKFKFTRLKIVNLEGKLKNSLDLRESFKLVISGHLSAQVEDLSLGFGLTSSLGFPIFNSHVTTKDLLKNLKPGPVSFEVVFDPNILGPGSYSIDLGANGAGTVDWIPYAATISIERVARKTENDLHLNYDGVVLYPCRWATGESSKK